MFGAVPVCVELVWDPYVHVELCVGSQRTCRAGVLRTCVTRSIPVTRAVYKQYLLCLIYIRHDKIFFLFIAVY